MSAALGRLVGAAGFSVAVVAMSLLAGVFKRLFYKNWSFIR